MLKIFFNYSNSKELLKNLSFKLSLLVSSEFFNEGDLEKEKFKQEPIVNKDFEKTRLPKVAINK